MSEVLKRPREEATMLGDENGRLPVPRFPPLSAPGPSGERPSHLIVCLTTPNLRGRRRFVRAMEVLTVKFAVGLAKGSKHNWIPKMNSGTT